MFRRHPILIALAALCLLGAAAVAVFIATFDLNRYREQLQTTLSAALSRPVSLGEAHLSLRHGPALDFADLRIGEEGETGVLRAAHLLLKPELLPLLQRKLTFSEVVLEAPQVSLTLDPPATEGAKPYSALLLDHGMLQSTLIRSLRIADGTLRLLDRRDPDRPYAVTLDGLEAKFANLSLNRPVHLKIGGNLSHEGVSSPFLLKGEVELDSHRPGWEGVEVQLELALDRFPPAALLQRYASGLRGLKTAGTLSLDLKLSGSPATGLLIDGRMDGEHLSLHFPDRYREPFTFRNVRFKGGWTDGGALQKFSDLSLMIDDLSFQGAFTLERRSEGSWLEGELASGGLPLIQLGRFLPDRDPASAAARLKKSLGGGTLEIASLRLSGPVSDLRRLDAGTPLRQAELRVRDAILRLDRPGPLRGLTFAARWEENRFTVSDGKGFFLNSPFRFSGMVLDPLEVGRIVKLQADGILQLRPLLSLVPAPWPEKLQIHGPVPLKLKAEGPSEKLLIDLQADLQDVGIGWGEGSVKAEGEPGSLFLTGEITPAQMELSHSRLQIPLLEARAQGSIEQGGGKRFRVSLDLTSLKIQKLIPLFPQLERIDPRGDLSLRYELAGAQGEIRNRQGMIFLRDFGMHLGGPLADIHDAGGEIRLLADGAEFDRLSAKLGASPVRLDGTVRDFADPRLDLHVRAQTIRANELIFPSEQAVLRDVDGQLAIDKGGISFDTVKVRLDGGTIATVRGTLKGFKAPQVTLDITAERANIDEVIALWQREKGDKREREGVPRAGGGSVLITARVAEGVLGPLHFQNAEGEIAYAGGLLTIRPLRFSSGAGRCTGQVVLEKKPDGSPLLKISGHLEKFDAAELHHELLKRRGLVTGTLQGDFYLEGEPGSRFLPTSLGGFNLQIKDGVLRQFHFLSKVFSVLNVSQIFALKLPDMAEEGMPFKRLKGNVAMKNGVLSTEDMFVDSNAMNLSLVGNADLKTQKLDLVLGVKPLRTLDKIVTKIPVAGWLLAGEEKALITAHFEIKGKSDDPEVVPIPFTSVSEKARGIFKRVLDLPGKVVDDVGDLIEGGKK